MKYRNEALSEQTAAKLNKEISLYQQPNLRRGFHSLTDWKKMHKQFASNTIPLRTMEAHAGIHRRFHRAIHCAHLAIHHGILPAHHIGILCD